jgi:hypothetical protein
MRLLVRLAFWLGVVFVYLPTGSEQSVKQVSAKPASPTNGEWIDVNRLCAGRREACAAVSQAVTSLGEKAQAGSKAIYGLIGERLARETTGSLGTKSSSSRSQQSQDTLKSADLMPAWRNPDRRDEAAAKRPL